MANRPHATKAGYIERTIVIKYSPHHMMCCAYSYSATWFQIKFKEEGKQSHHV